MLIIACNLIGSISRGLGDSNMPLVFVGIACEVDIVGDLLFVAALHWDVAALRWRRSWRRRFFVMKWEYIRFSPEISNFVRVGAPIAFQEIAAFRAFPGSQDIKNKTVCISRFGKEYAGLVQFAFSCAARHALTFP